ncbi:MAG: hypothetical protein H0T73_13885 [Ardenticatenales bacterium]|nr:hypothetical protein [Ardenticatenales bacterium]
MVIYDSYGAQLSLGQEIARGSESILYAVNWPRGTVAKLFYSPTEEQFQKLTWMLKHPPLDPGQATGRISFTWPSTLLFNKVGRFVGYLMPALPRMLSLMKMLQEFYDPSFQERMERTGQLWDVLHRIARHLAGIVDAIHKKGYIIGDLHMQNIFVSLDGGVTLIDTDSVQVKEFRIAQVIVYPAPPGKVEYMPPEFQFGLPRELEHDYFGLGVLIFTLLLLHHPFRSQWLGAGSPPPLRERIRRGWFPYSLTAPGLVDVPKDAPGLHILHPTVADLIRRCFVQGHKPPLLRPSPSEWARALAEAELVLVQCRQHHYFIPGYQSCPWCRAARKW